MFRRVSAFHSGSAMEWDMDTVLIIHMEDFTIIHFLLTITHGLIMDLLTDTIRTCGILIILIILTIPIATGIMAAILTDLEMVLTTALMGHPVVTRPVAVVED